MKSSHNSSRLLGSTFLQKKNRWLLNIGYPGQLFFFAWNHTVSWRSLIIIF